MQPIINPQSEFNYAPSHLRITNAYYEKYEEVSRILDENPAFGRELHRDLEKPLKYGSGDTNDGDATYTTDNVLRILICQVIEGASLRAIVVRIDDSNFLRHFTRIYNGPMMDFTTLDKLKNSIRETTWRKVNRLLADYAVSKKLVEGDRLRVDTTAVETNIHWPTDSSLLWDAYRTLARLIEQARELNKDIAGDRRLQKRRAKRLHTRIANKVGKGRSSEVVKPLYDELLSQVEDVSDLAALVADRLRDDCRGNRYDLMDHCIAEALIEQIDHFRGLTAIVIDQAARRVLHGEQVPNDEKIFSLFEPHTELLKRGKAGKPIEFGHMVQFQQVSSKFITDYEVFEKKPVEHELVDRILESHEELFGSLPEVFTADKNYATTEVLQQLREKIPMVSIGKKGKRTDDDIDTEHDPVFRQAQQFRAGVEGTISFLKRVLRLDRCLNKGWSHYTSTVGFTVLSHNLLILARS